jgi:hypothetical protein
LPLAGGGVAREVAGVLNQAAQIGAEFEARRRTQRNREEADNAFTTFSRSMDELDAEVIRGDDISAILTNFDSQSEALRSQISESIESEDARAAFDQQSQQSVTLHRAAVGKEQFKREQVAGRVDLGNNLKDLAASISLSRGPLITEQLTNSALEMIDSTDLLLEEQKGPAKQQFLTDVDTLKITTLLDLADAATTEEEALGHLTLGIAMLDKEDTPNLDPTTRTALRRQLEAERDDAIKRFNVGLQRELSKDIAEASTPAEVKAADAKIGKLLEKGVIEEPRAVQMDANLRARIARVDSADNGAKAVEVSLATGVPLDPEQQSYYEEIFSKDLVGKTDEQKAEAILTLVAASDMLPTQIEAGLRRAANGDNAELAAVAAERFIAFREVSPQAVARISDPTAIFLENMNESIELGVSAQSALETQREIQKLTHSATKEIQRAYSVAQSQQTDGEWLVENSDIFSIDRGVFRFDASSDDIPLALQGAFAAEVNRQHALDPNMDKARVRASKRMTKFWGVTEVGGGDARIEYLAPELMYPVFNNDSEEITKQLISYLRGIGAPEIIAEDDDSLKGRLLLAADATSLREHSRAGRLTPGYNVYLVSEGDDPSPAIVLDQNDLPARFWPNGSESTNRQMAEKLIQAQGERAIRDSTLAAQRLRRKGEERAEELIETGPGLIVPRETIRRRDVQP